MSNELMKRDEGVGAVTIYDRMTDPLVAVEKMGEFFARSGMFGCTKPEQGQILALACMAERKSPFEIKRLYHLVDGSLSMRSDAMLALYRQRGGKVLWKQVDDKAAVAQWIYDGNDLTLSYTIDEARAAGYIKPKSAWEKTPGAMLRARLITTAVRMLCPEAIAGCYTPEEIIDSAPAPTATAADLLKAPAPAPAPAQPEFKPDPAPPVVEVVNPATAPTKQAAPLQSIGEIIDAMEMPTAGDPLEEKLTNHEPAVNSYLAGLGWIRNGQTWRDLTDAQKAKIAKSPDRFIQAAERTAAK